MASYSSYGARWVINFVARNNDKYRLEILQAGWSATPVPLYGADSPFDTEEDNGSDLFMPLRKQTGTLRIVDNGYDMNGNVFLYTNIIPYDTFDRQVRLWKKEENGNTDTLRWVGYIRPDSLTSRLYEGVSIREFPVVCALGTLYDKSLSISNNETNHATVKTIGQILYSALNSVGIDWQYVYKQNNVQNTEDLTARISLLNFINDDEPTHEYYGEQNYVTATWTDQGTSYGDILDNICKFFGWVLYSRGLDIYIVVRQNNAPFARLAFADLTSETNTHLTDVSTPAIHLIEDLEYASTDHSTMRSPGYRKITIEANTNVKGEVMNPDLEKIDDYVYFPVAGDPNNIIHQDGDYQFVVRRLGTANVNRKYVNNFEIYENRIIQVQTLTAEFVSCMYESWLNEYYTTKTDFNFETGVCCFTGGQISNNCTFWMSTLNDVIIPKGSAICIVASAIASYDPSVADNIEGRIIRVSLSVGNKYWDPANNQWTTNVSIFEIEIGWGGNITTPRNGYAPNWYGVLWDNHYGSKGYCIYSDTEGLSGRLKLRVYTNTGSPTSYSMTCVLKGLNVIIVNEDSKTNPVNEATHTYEAVASTLFSRNLEVSLNMASGNKNKYGLGQLFTQDYQLLTTIPYRVGQSSTYTAAVPEENLLSRMTNCYSFVKNQNTIEVMDNEDACLPSASFSGISSYRLLNVAHKWREGTMKLTMID